MTHATTQITCQPHYVLYSQRNTENPFHLAFVPHLNSNDFEVYNLHTPTYKYYISSHTNHKKGYMTTIGHASEAHIHHLIFSAIAWHPDILYLIIKLPKYSLKVTRIHYIAVNRVFNYMWNTINDDLQYL